jgi:hypothetical protein
VWTGCDEAQISNLENPAWLFSPGLIRNGSFSDEAECSDSRDSPILQPRSRGALAEADESPFCPQAGSTEGFTPAQCGKSAR